MKFLTVSVYLLCVVVEGCYYNHELPVDDFLLKWRDASAGPLPGVGFEITQVVNDAVFELEGQDVTAISCGNSTYEFSVPFTFNEVEFHQKSLCDWDYGCAHCQHVAEDLCSTRLSAISALSDHLAEMVNGADSNKDEVPEEIPAAFEAMIVGLTKLCVEYVVSPGNSGDEEYVTNGIIDSCLDDCLSV